MCLPTVQEQQNTHGFGDAFVIADDLQIDHTTGK